MPQKLGARKHQRVKKKATSHQPLTYQGMAPFIVCICFAASSHNTTRWISLAFLIDMFSSSYSFSPYSIYFCCSFLFTTSGWWFLQKKLSYSPTQPRTRHLFTPENEVCDESQLPLRKLAVDSHLISLPRVDNCSVPHHTCLYSASTGELTRTSLIWVGGEEEFLSRNSLFFVILRRKVSCKSCSFWIWSKPLFWHRRLV